MSRPLPKSEIQRLFGSSSGEKVINRTGLFSCTPIDHFRILENVLKEHLPGYTSWKVLDGCACAGADTLHFAEVCDRVLAIEKNEEEFRLLTQNVAGIPNVETRHDTCLNHLNDPDVGMIYFDPPWGGPEHRTSQSMPMCDNKPISEIVQSVFEANSYITVVVKIPDYTEFSIPEVNAIRINLINSRSNKPLYSYIIFSKWIPSSIYTYTVEPFNYHLYIK